MYRPVATPKPTPNPQHQTHQTHQPPQHPCFAPPHHAPQGAPTPPHGPTRPIHPVPPSQVHTVRGGMGGAATALTCTTHGVYLDAGDPFPHPPRPPHPHRSRSRCAPSRRSQRLPPPPRAAACTWSGAGQAGRPCCLPPMSPKPTGTRGRGGDATTISAQNQEDRPPKKKKITKPKNQNRQTRCVALFSSAFRKSTPPADPHTTHCTRPQAPPAPSACSHTHGPPLQTQTGPNNTP